MKNEIFHSSLIALDRIYTRPANRNGQPDERTARELQENCKRTARELQKNCKRTAKEKRHPSNQVIPCSQVSICAANVIEFRLRTVSNIWLFMRHFINY